MISIDVVDSKGNILTYSRIKLPELFHAVLGGMGLTGVITRATLRLKPIETSFISKTILRTKNLEETLHAFDDANDVTYSVAWIDSCTPGNVLGRSVVFLGEHVSALVLHPGIPSYKVWNKKPLPILFSLPDFALSHATARIFNSFYYHTHSPKNSLVPYEPFFYPLDGLSDWNRLYGKRGSLEYQCVVPKVGGVQAIQSLIERVAISGCPSFIGVMKAFGIKNNNLLSFPMEGYTLGLEFPVCGEIFPLLGSLDDIVMRVGGRLYLAKDARMPKEVFDAGYPRAEEFRRYKRNIDPTNKFRSLQSMRLGLY